MGDTQVEIRLNGKKVLEKGNSTIEISLGEKDILQLGIEVKDGKNYYDITYKDNKLIINALQPPK
jgi:outer membrane lipoprotein-sorting protein